MISPRWKAQDEALEFARSHKSSMLNMEMGTGKTRVAIDTVFSLEDVKRILVVCPKAVVPVWRENLMKFATGEWLCFDKIAGTVKKKAEDLKEWLHKREEEELIKKFVVINYDSVWRTDLGKLILNSNFDMVILDESHRAKAAGSKVSKFLALLGKRVKRKMCLSGTPMANSPLDVYGQFRFLDPQIFGTNHFLFLQEYAIMGGPERRFIVGFKNQKKLNEKFNSITYTCKMADIKDSIKLPDALPPIKRTCTLPAKDMKIMRDLNKEFIAECNGGHVVVNNVLTKLVRLQQICSGFCFTQEEVLGDKNLEEMNTVKEDALSDILLDLDPTENIVVFCQFKHDLEAVHRATLKAKRDTFELSGAWNELEAWKKSKGGIIAVQIQAGAEGIDMTKARHAIYFSIPHSLALYNQSKARIYRPNQTKPVSFIHLICEGTVDESIYNTLQRKEDTITAIQNGSFNFGYLR